MPAGGSYTGEKVIGFDIFNRPCAYVVKDGVLVSDHGMILSIYLEESMK